VGFQQDLAKQMEIEHFWEGENSRCEMAAVTRLGGKTLGKPWENTLNS